MAHVITFGNFKGGVGKTTASCLISYLLNKKGYKTLLIDLDPQANATGFLTYTYGVSLHQDFTSIFEAMEGNDLRKSRIPLDNGFDLLPSANDLTDFRYLVAKKTKGKQADMEHFLLTVLLSSLKQEYDYIIIDVPPTRSEFTDNALFASDYALIIMQTEPDALLGAINFYEYIGQINAKITENGYNISPVRVLGVLPYLKNKRSKIDQSTIKRAEHQQMPIKDLVFQHHIHQRERVKRFRLEGITDKHYHDKQVFKMYGEVLNELLEKVGNNND